MLYLANHFAGQSPGDTMESLSRRTAGVDRPAQRFRLLTGLEAHAQARMRDRRRVVVD
jgi:predicted Zn-dependent protease